MKIFHYEVEPGDQVSLTAPDAENNWSTENLTSQTANLAHQAEVVTMFVNSKVDQAVIEQLPNLKLLVTRSTGFDHIDVAFAKSKGIIVSNVPAYGSRTVAEFTFALITSLSRKLLHAIEQVKLRNNWDVTKFEGFNLQGKTLGLVGTGRIGLNVAQIARGFDMTVLAFDAYPNLEHAEKYGFTYAENLESVLNSADVVTLHVPANKDTHHLINTENISQFKKGALLINTSRGDVVDPEAILTGLNQGILAGAGLDVLEGEQDLKEEAELMSGQNLNFEKLKILLEDHLLIDHPQVIITPHIAFNTKEARQEIIETTLANIESFVGGQPNNTVSL